MDKVTHRYLIPQDTKADRFDILPKFHKPGNPGRPDERISEFVSFQFTSTLLVQTLTSYI